MKAAKAGLQHYLTSRIHVLSKLTERGISRLYHERLGITLPQARAVAAVGAFGPFSVMDLAHCANLDKSQASRAAGALLAAGLLKRSASLDDGRMVVLALIQDGQACGGSDSLGHRFGVKPVFEKGSVDAEPNGCECRCTGGAGRGA